MTAFLVDVVIVNYHTETLIFPLLKCLEEEESVKGVFIVDNSATFSEFFKDVSFKFQKELKLILPEKNLGFGAAVNLAAEKSRSPYLLILNPDVRPFPGSIRALCEVAEASGATLCGPRFFWDEERFLRLPPAEGIALFWELAKKLASLSALEAELLSYYWRLRQEYFWAQSSPFFEPFLCGAALLLNRKKFSSPPFDPRFFLYFEDTDLSLELRQQGHLLLCVPQAEMVHFWNQSAEPPQGKERLFGESWRKFMAKHYASFMALLDVFEKNLPCGESSFNFEDLGPLKTPPVLGDLSGLKLEIAVNPIFIPYAHTDFLPPGSKTIPEKAFKRLPSGRLFLRVVDAYGNILKRLTFSKI